MKDKFTMNKILLFLFTLAGFCFGQSELSQAIDLVNNEKYDEADALLAPYLKEHFNDDRANYVKAILLTRKGKHSSALQYIEKAIGSQGDKGEYYQLAAQLYEEQNNTKSALEAWKKCQKYSHGTKLFVEAKNHLEFLKEE